MTKPYLLRPVCWERTDDQGIPLDCLDVMNYFNKALGRNLFPLVPRTDPITEQEIKDVWIPGKDNTITYVALDVLVGRAVGSGTLFLDGKTGELNITKDPDYKASGMSTSYLGLDAAPNSTLQQAVSICTGHNDHNLPQLMA